MQQTKKYIPAFTLIELLVVIVIIGILATVSTRLFGDNKSKALIAKYQAERVQTSKEIYKECITVTTEHCGPSFVVYSNESDGGSLYKKDLNSPSSDPGRKLTNNSGQYPAVAPDGRTVIYFHVSSEQLYKKDIHSLDLGPGEVFTDNFVEDRPAITPDGRFVIYVNIDDSYNLYKKDIEGLSSDPGAPFLDVGSSSPSVTPDGLFVVYSTSSGVYKKGINSSSSDLGTQLTNIYSFYPVVTPDGETLFYINPGSFADDNVYRKDIDSPSSDLGGIFRDDDSVDSLAITSDGRLVLYSLYSSRIYKKNINSPSSDSGDLFIDNSGGFPAVFP